MNKFPCGHLVTERNTIMRAGGYKGRKYRNCRVCYCKQRNKSDKLRYQTDPVYRDKRKAKTNDYRKRKRAEETPPSWNEQPKLDASGPRVVPVA